MFLSKIFHFHPVCVSCDHFISRQEKTTSVIADLIGKHGSPGCTYVSCHVRLLDNSQPLQNHIIPKMGTVYAFHFPTIVLYPILHSRWFQLPRLGGWGAGIHLQPPCYIARRFLCVCAHLFSNLVHAIHPLVALS